MLPMQQPYLLINKVPLGLAIKATNLEGPRVGEGRLEKKREQRKVLAVCFILERKAFGCLLCEFRKLK